MNNIYYLELADMILPKEVRKSNNFSNFEIMYKKEIQATNTTIRGDAEPGAFD